MALGSLKYSGEDTVSYRSLGLATDPKGTWETVLTLGLQGKCRLYGIIDLTWLCREAGGAWGVVAARLRSIGATKNTASTTENTGSF